ncbi:hypothetical protein J6590_102258, partial [Homalodisca vitripennis]
CSPTLSLYYAPRTANALLKSLADFVIHSLRQERRHFIEEYCCVVITATGKLVPGVQQLKSDVGAKMNSVHCFNIVSPAFKVKCNLGAEVFSLSHQVDSRFKSVTASNLKRSNWREVNDSYTRHSHLCIT